MTRGLALYFLSIVIAMSILPQPFAPPTLLAVKIAPPWAVALVASLAAAVTAVVDYYIVRRAFGLKLLARVRNKPLFVKAERWAKVAPFLTTAAFAGLPLPFTVVRVLMPLSGYPLMRYVAAVVVGRYPRIFLVAWVGTVIEIPTDVLIGLLVGGVVVVLLAAIARKLGWIPKVEERAEE